MKKLLDAPAMLVVMRVARMTKAHPKTDFTHRCARCHEPVGIFPSGQRLLREQPNVEIVCDGCAGGLVANQTSWPHGSRVALYPSSSSTTPETVRS